MEASREHQTEPTYEADIHIGEFSCHMNFAAREGNPLVPIVGRTVGKVLGQGRRKVVNSRAKPREEKATGVAIPW